jgi:flagellar M-ring protein FliF
MIERFRSAPPGRQLLFAVMAAAVLGAALFAMWFTFMRMPYEPLFTKMRALDAATIVTELDKQKIPYRLGDGGTTILVPGDKVASTRLDVMSEDLPLKGTVGFELFNKSDMGLTDFAQKINYQRALQGELERTITSLAGVESARVHLSLGQDRIFRDEQVPPKASVTIHMRDGTVLPGRAAQGIQRLVAAAVPQLDAANVVILDEDGDVIGTQVATQAMDQDAAPITREQVAIEQFYAARIQMALEKVFPAKSANVVVHAELAAGGDETQLPQWSPASRNFPLRVVIGSPARPSSDLQTDTRNIVEEAIGARDELHDMVSFTTISQLQSAPTDGPQGTDYASRFSRRSADQPSTAEPDRGGWLSWRIVTVLTLIALALAYFTTRRRTAVLSSQERAAFAARLRAALDQRDDHVSSEV